MELGVRSVRPWGRAGERFAGTPAAAARLRSSGQGGADLALGASSRAVGGRDHGDVPYDARYLGGEEARWDALIHWAGTFFTAAGFSERELNPALDAAEQLRRVRGAVLARGRAATWRALLERALAVSPVPAGAFSRWCEMAPVEARDALRTLWTDDLTFSAPGRLRLFLAALPPSAVACTAESLQLGSFLLSAIDPALYPVYDAAADGAGQAMTGAAPGSREDAAGTYRQMLLTLDQVIAAAVGRRLALRHRLHAAAVLRCVARTDGALPDAWSADDRRRFRAFQATLLPGGTPGHMPETQSTRAARIAGAPGVAERRAVYDAAAAGEDSAPRTLNELAHGLLLDVHELEKIQLLLEDRPQCIFYGPPGTGKTFVARQLGRFLAGSSERVRVVQFHPSYAYEDFVEGYRPVASGDGGAAGFELVDGPLKRIAQVAADDPAHRYVLVIDELNRSNVSKVFGELHYLLEYRGDSVLLQYSQAPFALPRNLLVIGTMNAADRSIAMVDLALRRRFYFVPFFPDTPPVEGLLRRWLERHTPDLCWLADVVDRANARLADRHTAIGPSHFMRPDLSEAWIELIWEHSVLPALAEQFTGDEEALAEFQLGQLRRPERQRRKRHAPSDAG